MAAGWNLLALSAQFGYIVVLKNYSLDKIVDVSEKVNYAFGIESKKGNMRKCIRTQYKQTTKATIVLFSTVCTTK